MESGLCRSKNSISIAAKNIVDGCVAFLLFWFIGYGFLFGSGWGETLGGQLFFYPNHVAPPHDLARFFFFGLFCCTTSTIISGAIAERVHFGTYLAITIAVAGVLFPLCAYTVWAENGILSKHGFIDFAGSTVVHSTGGWDAPVVVFIVGARKGRFSATEPWAGSQLPFAVLGALLLCLGWLGFNAGSGLKLDNRTFPIIINTILGISSALVTGVFIARLSRGYYPLKVLLLSPLAGAASSSAFAPYLTFGGAIALGALAGFFATYIDDWMLKLKLDDAVGAVPVHLGGGFLGTVLGPLFVDIQLLPHESITELLLIQLVGASLHGLIIVSLSILIMKLIGLFYPLRINEEEEIKGLNVVEHQSTTELGNFVGFLRRQQENDKHFFQRARVDEYSEIGEIAFQYNTILDGLNERERSLRAARELADKANLAKSEFLSNMSHELRTPLTTIIGYAELLEEQLEKPHNREDLARIQNSAHYLLAMINDLLDMAKIEAGKLPLHPVVVNSKEFFQDLEKSIAPMISRQRNNLIFEIENTPESIYMDPKRVKQILLNLLSNAAKFTSDGTITLRSQSTENRIFISVTDTGAGMAPEAAAKIFDEFIQVHDISQDSLAGTGLGLCICRRLLNQMYGDITVESKLGEGSTFTINFAVANPIKLAQ